MYHRTATAGTSRLDFIISEAAGVSNGFDFSSQDGRRPAPTQFHRAMSRGPVPVPDRRNNSYTPSHP